MFDAIGLSFEERQQVDALFKEFDPGLQEVVSSLFEGLNREQAAALAHPLAAGLPLLIIAGAGSGKTSVLTRRVTLLLLAGIPTEQVFVSTFTVKAAGEMKERIGKLIESIAKGASGALKIKIDDLLRSFPRAWIGTFHSLCLRLLKEKDAEGFSPIEELGYPPTIQMLSDAESRKMLKEIAGTLPVQPDMRELTAAMDLAANELLTPQTISDKKIYAGVDAAVIADAWTKYMEAKRAKGAVDFTDLLYLAATAFADRRMCAERWRKRFTHVLIDEYQDTNIAQYAIATELAAARKDLFVVGDDDQSIYRFRGADIRNIRAFTDDYPNARVVRLIRNYRSTPVILGAANAVLANREDGSADKTLLASAPDGGKIPEKIALYEAIDDQDEMNFLTFQIKELIAEGFAYRDIVIFYRIHEFSEGVAAHLRASQIPYVEAGGKSFLGHPLVKTLGLSIRAVNLLRLRLEGRFDAIHHATLLGSALQEIWTLGKLGPKNKEDRAMLQALPLPEAILLEERGYVEAVQNCKSGETQKHLEMLWSAFHGGAQGLDSITPHQLVNFLIDALGLAQDAREDDEIRAGLTLVSRFLSSRLPYTASGREGIDQLLSAMHSSEQGEPAADLTQENAIRLLTIHTSKGLEFPVVFVIGVEENILPFVHAGAAKDETAGERIEREEEELRLFYVAITRAKQRLILTCAAKRTWFGRTVSNRPSRFLARLPDELVNRGSGLSSADKAAHRTKQFFKDLFGA